MMERGGYRFENWTIPDEVLEVCVNGFVLDWWTLLTDEQREQGDPTFDEVVALFLAHPDREVLVIKPGHPLWDEEEVRALNREWLDANGYDEDDTEASPYARRLRGWGAQ